LIFIRTQLPIKENTDECLSQSDFKQQRFTEEYQVGGSGSQAVLQLVLKVEVIL
tara:strand:- start:2802 stop:2963 length:162 start_codon:yes stop_codon:yes gene_type:complete